MVGYIGAFVVYHNLLLLAISLERPSCTLHNLLNCVMRHWICMGDVGEVGIKDSVHIYIAPSIIYHARPTIYS